MRWSDDEGDDDMHARWQPPSVKTTIILTTIMYDDNDDGVSVAGRREGDGESAGTAVTVCRDVGWQHAAAGSVSSRPFCADANTASLPK